MQILFKIPIKKNPMKLLLLAGIVLVSSTMTFAQSADSSSYFLQKGLDEKAKGRRLESLKNFEKAIKYDATSKPVMTELASAYLDLRKYFPAYETYKKLVDMGDNSAATYKQLLSLSYNLKQHDDVIKYADQVKKADPSEKVSFFVGKVHYDRENYGEAIRTLNQAAKEEPANGEIPYMIARSYSDMSNHKQAIPYFHKAIELDTTKPNWIYEMGLIYYAIHDDKNALKYIQMAGDKGLNRDNSYLENLGIAYLNSGDLNKGVEIMDEVLKRKPSDINVLNMVAEAFYYKGNYQKAIDYWDQILYYDKENASALYMIGMSYQKKGDKAKGQQLCDKAIEMDPSLAALKQKKSMMGL
jgi:tetratricopeptide (TPR) repeat protein